MQLVQKKSIGGKKYWWKKVYICGRIKKCKGKKNLATMKRKENNEVWRKRKEHTDEWSKKEGRKILKKMENQERRILEKWRRKEGENWRLEKEGRKIPEKWRRKEGK